MLLHLQTLCFNWMFQGMMRWCSDAFANTPTTYSGWATYRQLMMSPRGDTQAPFVSRFNIFEDGIGGLLESSPPVFKIPLEITFYGKKAQDYGEPKKEFLSAMCHEMKDWLFKQSDDGDGYTLAFQGWEGHQEISPNQRPEQAATVHGELHADPERFAAFKQKERYDQNKTKKKKPTARETRHNRKRWRESQEKCRKKSKGNLEKGNVCRKTVPPSSPVHVSAPNAVFYPEKTRTQTNKKGPKLSVSQGEVSWKSLESALVQERRRADKYEKRLQRLNNTKTNSSSTPKKETRQLIGDGSVSPSVRKSLLFGSAICLAIRNRYKNSKSYKEKQCIAKMLALRLRRCKLSSTAATFLGIPRESMKSVGSQSDNANTQDRCDMYERKVHNCLARRLMLIASGNFSAEMTTAE